MRIDVYRFYSSYESTLSAIYVDDKFVCFGLEDGFRDIKVAGETRIPSGTYNIGIRDTGGFHNRYSNRFSRFHKGMLQVINVPNFEYILIHVGNTAKDTEGCLLVGKDFSIEGEPTVWSSVVAYTEFYNLVIEEAIKGNVTIEYTDLDR